MSEHTERFTGRADGYDKYRLRFSPQVLEELRQRCGLTPEDTVADVGAGTGMLAELFLRHGNPVIAVEPNADMRHACLRLESDYPRLRVVDAAAESTGLLARSIDMVAVGRAFHWFDRDRALAEFQRILKPGGWVVLVSAHRAHDASQQAREFESILMTHGIDYDTLHQVYRAWETLKPYGEAGERFVVKIPGETLLTLEEFLGQTQSLSVTPLPGHPKHGAMQQALHEFFTKWSVDGKLRLETVGDIVGWRTPKLLQDDAVSTR